MKKITIIVLLAFAISLTISIAIAQDGGVDENGMPINDFDYSGLTPNDLNWCFEGQPWAGQCNAEYLDEWEIAWMWNCGWYEAHRKLGFYSSVPEWCESSEVYDGICSVYTEYVNGKVNAWWDIWNELADGEPGLNPGTDEHIDRVHTDPGLPACDFDGDDSST